MFKSKQDTIAIVYDFDETLTPQPMQEYTILRDLGVDAGEFWKKVGASARKDKADKILTYMRLLIDEAKNKQRPITKSRLLSMGHSVEFYKGVPSWFGNLNKYVHKIGKGRVRLRHYIVSAGLKEIIQGTSIAKHFRRVYACEYYYDSPDPTQGRPTFPKVLITETEKTRYLFMIHKGLEDKPDEVSFHMSDKDRPIPFSNIIYIGDGYSDVPSMTVVRKNGGHSIAVFDPQKTKKKKICQELLRGGRVDSIAAADYRNSSELTARVKLLLDALTSNIRYKLGYV